MTLNCAITHHSGSGGHITKTVSVRELIVDDQILYKIVKDHVFNCSKCDPIEVIECYLNRRKNRAKFQGFTSATLVKLVNKYNNEMIKRNRGSIPKELFREFVWRSGHSGTLIKYESLLSNMDIWNAVHLIYCSTKTIQLIYLRDNQRFQLIDTLMNGRYHPETEEELNKLMLIAGVSES